MFSIKYSKPVRTVHTDVIAGLLKLHSEKGFVFIYCDWIKRFLLHHVCYIYVLSLYEYNVYNVYFVIKTSVYII